MITMLEIVSISLLATFFISLLLKWLFNSPSNKKNLPPSPGKLPIIGNFHQLGLLAHQSLHSLAQKNGSIILLHLGRVPTVVISSAEAASEIMKTHDLVFADRPKIRIFKTLMYDSKDVSVAPYGEFWRQLKSIYMLQLLSNKKVQSFRGVREEEVTVVMNKITDFSSQSLPINLTEMFTSYSNDVISRAAFSRKHGGGLSGEKFKQLLRDYLGLLGRFDVGDYFPILSWVSRLNGIEAEAERVAREIDEFLEGLIQERINGVGEQRNYCDVSGEGKHENSEDFLDTLLRIYKGDTAGVCIDRDSMKALILTAFAAGTDTTTTFLEWAMSELLKHPSIMKKVQNDVRKVVAGKKEITEEDLKKMHYLQAAIKETFRLHPPIPLLVPRVAREDVKVMGYDIAAGTVVMTNAYAIGRDPALWDEPEEFKPERFLNSTIDTKGLDFELIPFGAGRRGCPGISFATAVFELLLANIVHKFDWKLPSGSIKEEELDMSESPGITVHRKLSLLAIATPCPCQ